jgi:lysine-specific demethylase/histidyl-hydroxylase NO66
MAKKRMTDAKRAVVTNQQGQSRASKKRAKKKQNKSSGGGSDRLLVEPPSWSAVAAAAAADPPRSTAGQERPSKEPRESQEDEGLDFFEEEATKKVHFEAADYRDDGGGIDNHCEGDGHGNEQSIKKKPQPPCGDALRSSLGGTAESPLLPPPSAKTIAELLAPPSPPWPEATTEQRARRVLDFLLRPAGISADEFYAGYWEKRPLLVQFQGSPAQPPPSRTASGPHPDPQRDDHRRRLSGLMSLSGIQAATRRRQQQQGQRLPGDDESDGSVLCYGRDLNVTKYERDAGTGLHRRRTLDPAAPTESDTAAPNSNRHAPVDPDELWGRFYGGMGCTVRLLCPHRHFGPVHSLLSLLEHEFGCMVGANAYLTPPRSSQGFAPHYDDVEAFVCQLEGRKRWRVHAPLRDAERLPRASSRDYDPSELARAGSLPVLDAVLEPGDVLYMPRGWIHHACTLPEAELSGGGPSEPSAREDGHSLHLTVSTMQNWAWADLLEGLFEGAIGSLAGSGSTALLREGLPRNFLSYTGVAHDPVEDAALPDSLKRGRPAPPRDGGGGEEEDEEDAEEAARLRRHERLRDEFRREARRRIARVAQEALRGLDAACDEMAKRFVSDRLPPAGLHLDRGASVGGESGDDRELQLTTLCRLARPGIARLVLEDGKAVVYHCADNSLVYHGKPLSPLEFEADDGPALEQLVTTVEPRWVAVQDLFHDTPDDKLAVAQALYDEGILAVRSE